VHARSTTFQARASEIDAGIRFVADEVMPAITRMPGCIGLSMLADRQSGRCIATSAWSDEQAMRDSDSALAPLRQRAGEILGGSPQVDEWEIGVLHREHRTGDSTCVRCTWLQMDPSRLDETVDMFRSEVLPAVEEMDGFCSASLLLDRRSGRAVSSTAWDSRAAMAASRDAAMRLRADVTQRFGAQITDVAEFEIALAHLRVPEMA
jgi:heme-degrading monooxygenase HmoA